MSKADAQLAVWPEWLEDWPAPEAWEPLGEDWADVVADWPLIEIDWPEPETWEPLGIDWDLSELTEGWELIAPWPAEDTPPPVVNK